MTGRREKKTGASSGTATSLRRRPEEDGKKGEKTGQKELDE
jgi:hypothetical protein